MTETSTQKMVRALIENNEERLNCLATQVMQIANYTQQITFYRIQAAIKMTETCTSDFKSLLTFKYISRHKKIL